MQVAAEVGGRLIELKVAEGDRVSAGDLIARLDTTAVGLALRRARAERDQMDAQLRLLRAGSRVEDIRLAEAQVAAAEADVAAARADLDAAVADFDRFESLLRSNSGSQKQRDDAATTARRRAGAAARRRAARAGRERHPRAAAGRGQAGGD